MLSQQRLLDIGLAADLAGLQRLLVTAAQDLGFGLVTAVTIHGDLRSGSAWVRSIGNTPPAYVAAQHSVDDTLRDPVMGALLSSPLPVTYDQQLYVDAGAADLWDVQAPFGYRHGVACSVHQAGHAEHFLLGVDREDALPNQAGHRAHLCAQLQLITLHAQEAMQRLLSPAAHDRRVTALTDAEAECLKWAAAGMTAWQIGDLLSISLQEVYAHQTAARRKLGAASGPGAVLRAIQGGLVEP